MMDRRRSGSWWHPDDPSRRVIGTVTRDGDAWRLELVGTLLRTATRDDDDRDVHDVYLRRRRSCH